MSNMNVIMNNNIWWWWWWWWWWWLVSWWWGWGWGGGGGAGVSVGGYEIKNTYRLPPFLPFICWVVILLGDGRTDVRHFVNADSLSSYSASADVHPKLLMLSSVRGWSKILGTRLWFPNWNGETVIVRFYSRVPQIKKNRIRHLDIKTTRKQQVSTQWNGKSNLRSSWINHVNRLLDILLLYIFHDSRVHITICETNILM